MLKTTTVKPLAHTKTTKKTTLTISTKEATESQELSIQTVRNVEKETTPQTITVLEPMQQEYHLPGTKDRQARASANNVSPKTMKVKVSGLQRNLETRNANFFTPELRLTDPTPPKRYLHQP